MSTPHVLVLEPDRVVARCIADELTARRLSVSLATNADEAMTLADQQSPDLVIAELSIPGHSGSEFLYEFRTYSDWHAVPIVIFSSLKPSRTILASKDWKLLAIQELLYKPDASLEYLGRSVESILQP
jgi:two-component system KDP operon response regulator KdpE